MTKKVFCISSGLKEDCDKKVLRVWFEFWINLLISTLNRNDVFSQRERRISKQSPEACLFHIQMSWLIIKTVILAVVTAVALTAGDFWLQDVLRLERNMQTFKPSAQILFTET